MADIVQIKNPRTKLYVKINRSNGTIVSHKKTPGPYSGIPITIAKRRGKRVILKPAKPPTHKGIKESIDVVKNNRLL